MDLFKEDYEEPGCPFDCSKYSKDKKLGSVPVARVISKLDEEYSRNDISAAEKVLLYWINEAKMLNDLDGELSLSNEAIGFYRKNPNEEKAFKYGDRALEIIEILEISESVTAATTYVNYATMAKSFSKVGVALDFFAKAEPIYKKYLKDNDDRLGGLYNNMALALVDIDKYEEAKKYYMLAIETMEKVELGEREIAITYLNLADLENAIDSNEKDKLISDYIEKAYSLLTNKKIPRDGYSAFVYEKCAPTFGYYGYFLYENELKNEAKRIYDRT